MKSIRISKFFSLTSDPFGSASESLLDVLYKAELMRHRLKDVMILEPVKYETINSNGKWLTSCLIVNKGFIKAQRNEDQGI
jgi:hypothetical protein